MKDRESLQEASGKPRNLCSLPSTPFCSAHSRVDSWARSELHNLFSAVTDTNKLERPKNTSSMARFSHEWKVTIFLLFAIGISLRWKKLWKPPWSLEICVPSPPHHFVQPILAWIRELVPGFIICSAQLQIQTSLNDLKTHLPWPDWTTNGG